MQTLKLKLSGTTPLICHSTRGMSTTPEAGLRQGNGNLTGREEAELGTYLDDEGELVFPTIAVRNALYAAASGRKIRVNGTRTARSGLAGVIPTSEFMPLMNGDGKQATDFEVDTRFVRVPPRTGARVPRSRPKFSPWSLEFEIDYDENLIDARSIAELAEIAGKTVGLGDYRPEKAGTFGRFEVEVVK